MSNYKQIPENTFGETPAAMYLCRRLNEDKNSVALRSAGRRISGTAAQVRQLITAYEANYIDPKTLANLLRLMREEISSEPKPKENIFEDQLRRNVQIGYIKQGIRLASVARKAEHVMNSPLDKGRKFNEIEYDDGLKVQEIYFYDNQTGKLIKAGELYSNIKTNESIGSMVHIPIAEEVDNNTTELLHLRSNRRCLRLGKSHAKIN